MIISTPTDLIPRKIPENIKPIVIWFSELLDETVNFGSNILVWDDHPKTPGEENVPPTMMFRHFLDVIDSISILVREGSGDTSKILIRVAFEMTLYIEYLFEKNAYDRSMAYLISDTLNQIKIVKKLVPNRPESKDLYKTFKNENVLSELNKLNTSELSDFLDSKERLLKMPQFKSAYDEFLRLKNNKEKNPKWYHYFGGPENIEKLATYLKNKTMYELLYRKWSGALHGSDIYLGKIMRTEEKGRVDIVQIRFFKDLQEIVSYSLMLSAKVLRLFIVNRIPEKQPELTRWYMSMKEDLSKLSLYQFI